MMRTVVLSLAIACAAAWSSEARADFITSFQGAMQPNAPAAGWSYLWNSIGVIGNPANYTPLLPTTHPWLFYDEDGVSGLPTPGTDNFVYLGLTNPSSFPTTGGGHPGSGPGQPSAGGIERFAIAAYTLSTGGDIAIINSQLTNADTITPGGSVDGIDVLVFVNSNPVPFAASFTAPGPLATTTFDASLGTLSAGDTIYVAVGPRATAFADSFALQYDIATVPEPSSLLLFATGTGLCLAARLFRRRGAGEPFMQRVGSGF